MNQNAIYTVILNNYDTLHDPVIKTPGWDYICFTDDKDLKSDTWDVRHIEIDPGISPARMSRKVWILYHHYVPEYDLTISVPGYVEINIDLNVLIDGHFGDKWKDRDIAILRHPKHTTAYAAADKMIIKSYEHIEQDYSKNLIAVKRLKKVASELKKQVEYYKAEGMPKDIRSFPTGLLIRRGHRPNLEKHCELWWQEILKHSVRDQISFAYVIWKHNLVTFKTIGWKWFDLFFWGYDHHNYDNWHSNITRRRKKFIARIGTKYGYPESCIR